MEKELDQILYEGYEYRNRIASGEKVSGSECIKEHVIPGGTKVTIALGGSYTIYRTDGSVVATGEGVISAKYPLEVLAYDEKSGKKETTSRVENGKITLTSPDSFYICLKFPHSTGGW